MFGSLGLALQALLNSLSPGSEAQPNQKLDPKTVQKLSEKLNELVGGQLGEGQTQLRNEQGQLLNEEGLPIIDITEPVGAVDRASEPVVREDILPVSLSSLSASERTRLRLQRERILDLLEEEERAMQEKEELASRDEEEQEKRDKRRKAEDELARLKANKEMQRKMGKALLKDISSSNPKQTTPIGSSQPTAPRKSVKFADEEESEPQVAVTVEQDWGDVVPARLRANNGRSLLAKTDNTQTMRLNVVERFPGKPAATLEDGPDSDDESEPDSEPPQSPTIEDSDAEPVSDEEEEQDLVEEVDLDYAHAQRGVALENYVKRGNLGTNALRFDEDSRSYSTAEDSLIQAPRKNALSQFQANRLASSYNLSSGTNVPTASSARTLQQAVRLGKLDSDGRLVGEESDGEAEADLQDMMDLLRRGELYNIGPDAANPDALHVIPPLNQFEPKSSGLPIPPVPAIAPSSRKHSASQFKLARPERRPATTLDARPASPMTSSVMESSVVEKNAPAFSSMIVESPSFFQSTRPRQPPTIVKASEAGKSKKNQHPMSGAPPSLENGAPAPARNVRSPQPSSSTTSSASSVGGFDALLLSAIKAVHWPASLQWIPGNFTWAKIKPVIRCSITAWLSLVLFLIPSVEVMLGNASFLVLISVSFLSPPNDPLMSVVERELNILLFVTVAWAWSCLGIKLADFARVNRDPTVTLSQAVTGQYLEVAPSVIIGVFIFLGSVTLLSIKARAVPSQIFACVLGCLGWKKHSDPDIVPLRYRDPMLNPRVSLQHLAQFTTRMGLVIAPLIQALEMHKNILQMDPYSPEFAATATKISAAVSKSEASLVPVAASARLLKGDLVYSRYAPTDLRVLQDMARRMAVRGNGMGIFFTLIEPMREKFPITPVLSRIHTPLPGSPAMSRPPSPPQSPRESVNEFDFSGEETSPPSPRSMSRSRHRHSHFHPHQLSLLHHTLLNLPLHRKKAEHAVGVFESHRYLDLEAHMHHPEAEAHTREITALLAQSCIPLLESSREALTWTQDWLAHVRQGMLGRLMAGKKSRRALRDRLEQLPHIQQSLKSALLRFNTVDRHAVLGPWRPSFESNGDLDIHDMPPHRHLFNCYVYQYHLRNEAGNILTMIDNIVDLEKRRTTSQLWTPVHSFDFSRKNWIHWHISDLEQDEEDPDRIPGVSPALDDFDLGDAKRRDPDALPPRNHFEWFMSMLYRAVAQLGRGNALFAIKGAILTILLCLPTFLKSSATFAYENKFVWGIFMGQVTISRFRGDTVFGLSSRVLSTFFGGLLGMVMWYISAGAGSGSAYGLGAVCAVCFPFFFYGRVYWPGPPMRVIIFFVTSVLVIGYSYQDHIIALPGSPGFGWDVAWRRFLLVTAGVLAAGIFSLLPPSMTIRQYERKTMATVVSELGTLYCDIISFANAHHEVDPQMIVSALIAVRSKINRSMTLKSNAVYEAHFTLSLDLIYAQPHRTVLYEGPLASRTVSEDHGTSTGDVLAVISMISTALRTGNALPQITPCPLVDRFQTQYGLQVIHKDSEEDYGLPRTLTLETLQNEQYLNFCVGVSTAYGIMTRLDRLMVTVKEIVGEQYHIHGAGLPLTTRPPADI
ncbi:unnamed protein product [Mycena citricolor]|uniref:DUF2421 domain-containing protein n=1 Tax=Mycena citricolor TaxID=2018698 RepID=A0AAD2HM12_9AGAR|nr:unnamed protein product [Mycena citricolor]